MKKIFISVIFISVFGAFGGIPNIAAGETVPFGVDHVVFNQQGLDLYTTGQWAPYVHDDRDSFMLLSGNNKAEININLLNWRAAIVRAHYPTVKIYAATSGLNNIRNAGGLNRELFAGLMMVYEPNQENAPEFTWDNQGTEEIWKEAAEVMRGYGIETWGKPSGRALAGRDKAGSWDYGQFAKIMDGMNVQTQGSCKNGKFDLAIDDLISQYQAAEANSRLFAQVTVASTQVNHASPAEAIECSKYAWSQQEIERVTLWSAPNSQQTRDEAETYLRLREGFIAPNRVSNHVGHWKFDEEVGNRAEDSSGNDNAGIRTGAAWVPGKVGIRALRFDGSGDYVNMGDKPIFDMGTGDFSIAAWVKTPETFWTSAVYRVIAGKASAVDYSAKNSSNGWALLLGNNGRLSFALPEVKPVSSNVTGFEANQWYHIAAAYSATAGTVTYYVDGSQLGAPKTIGNAGDIDNDYSFRVGAEADGGRAITATIDDVHVYSKALSQAEVFELMNPPLTRIDGDLNGDGKINVSDVSFLLSRFESTDPLDLTADISSGPGNVSSGIIDIFDINKLMVNWTG